MVNNAAWDNSGLGFNDEGNPGGLRLSRNTAFRNALVGFFLPDAAAVADANAAYANGRDVQAGPAVRATGNSWNVPAAAAPPSAAPPSADRPAAEGPRPTDGALPRTSFLVTRSDRGADMTEHRPPS
ncbi:hypothetical protein [Kitasatospora sp. NPDC088134]|uniref:hypothetical protein n=1 Tax=Kitasatospora sp. NPDC088134 TaxID=3364071 RepID=UPI00380C9CBB